MGKGAVDGHKRCSNRLCAKVLPVSDFYVITTKGGLSGNCKACSCAKVKEYRLKNPDKIKKRKHEAHKKHPDKSNTRSRVWRFKTMYSMTVDEFDGLLAFQGGGCATCGKPTNENGRRLDVDHDHKTGKVRGLLCNPCNRSVGRVETNRQWNNCDPQRAYLAAHPATAFFQLKQKGAQNGSLC